MNPKTLSLAALCLVLSLSAGAADWPGFRGPHGLGISEEKDLPTKWGDKENLAWKVDLPGPGSSSPVVWGDKVFVTCYTGYGIDRDNPGKPEDLRRHLICVDRKEGKILWDKEVKAKLPEAEFRGPFITLHGYASSTPVTDGERVYVFYGKSGVFAYDFAGKELWHESVGDETDSWGSGTSPILYKDFVIVNAAIESGNLVALNKKTGKEEWKTGGVSRCWGSPALVDVGGKQELVMSLPNVMKGYDPDTGKELWECNGITENYLCPTVVSRDGIAYVIGARDNTAIAVKAGGRGDVTRTNLLWTKSVGSNVTSPAVFGDHLYWVSDGGRAFCLKAKDGEIVYQERLGGGAYASVVLADGKVYAVTQHKGTYVLAVGPKFEQVAHNTLSDDSTFNGGPAVSGGQLFLRSDKALYCIGKKK